MDNDKHPLTRLIKDSKAYTVGFEKLDGKKVTMHRRELDGWWLLFAEDEDGERYIISHTITPNAHRRLADWKENKGIL